MAQFLTDYETVDSRIHKFWEKHPNGRINTSAEYYEADKRWVVRTEVFSRHRGVCTSQHGYAEEVIGSTMVNKTSALENCETSSIGRALANLGFATKGARPSVEEMGKAERQTPIPVKTTSEKWGVGVENMGKKPRLHRSKQSLNASKRFALDMLSSLSPSNGKWGA